MISSAKEAREIVFRLKRQWIGSTTITQEYAYVEAAGGLHAIKEWPEIKEFISRMETLAQAMPPNAISMNIGKALSQYYLATGEKQK